MHKAATSTKSISPHISEMNSFPTNFSRRTFISILAGLSAASFNRECPLKEKESRHSEEGRPGGVRALGGGQGAIGDSLLKRVDTEIVCYPHELGLCAAAIRRAFLRFNQANRAVIIFLPDRLSSAFHFGRLDPWPLYSTCLSFKFPKLRKGQLGAVAACCASDSQPEESCPLGVPFGVRLSRVYSDLVSRR